LCCRASCIAGAAGAPNPYNDEAVQRIIIVVKHILEKGQSLIGPVSPYFQFQKYLTFFQLLEDFTLV
jgi:hypothetical protein